MTDRKLLIGPSNSDVVEVRFVDNGLLSYVAADGGREQTAVDVEELELRVDALSKGLAAARESDEELEVKDEDDVRTDGGEDCEEADRC